MITKQLIYDNFYASPPYEAQKTLLYSSRNNKISAYFSSTTERKNSASIDIIKTPRATFFSIKNTFFSLNWKKGVPL